MQLLNFLVSITCFFLLLFSLHLLFAKKGYKRLNLLLATLFFARFGQIFTSFLMISGHQDALPFLFQLFTPFSFAAPACLYLYISGFIHPRTRVNQFELLHFLPAGVAIIHVIPWPGTMPLNWNEIAGQLSEYGYHSLRAKSGLFPAYFQYLFRPILIVIYLVLCWQVILKSKTRDRNLVKNPGRNWILFLLKITTFFQLAGLIPIVLRNLDIPIQNSFFIGLNCIVLLSILLYGLHRPHIFYGYLLVAIDWNEKNNFKEIAPTPLVKIDDSTSLQATIEPTVKAPPNKKINLSIEQTSHYAGLIREVMKAEQLYLQANLQIIDLANKINIPVHHCSHVINNHIGKNFRDWINGYRINHFLLQYPRQSEKITIEAIAQESGFRSQATFYNAFKKEKGMMPTAYFAQYPAETAPNHISI